MTQQTRTPYKLKLQTGEVILWEGATGEQAATGYAESHPGTVVVAWSEERHGLFHHSAYTGFLIQLVRYLHHPQAFCVSM